MYDKRIHSLLAIILSAMLLTACDGGARETTVETPQATESPVQGTQQETTPSPGEGQVQLRVNLAAENEVPA
ncbi:MAG: hypothetical protein M3198_19925, partial [Actinomycetota bacterium]|nr:hypothetical protein [Actinomycetota bacterium]